MKIIRYHFDVIDSTNTWAKGHVDEFDSSALILVTATAQTGGRGRFKRKWHSPSGVNIYATFCFFVEFSCLDRVGVGHIPQLLALSTVSCLEYLHFQPKVKWPNDVLLSGKKVAGILCETTSGQDERGRWVICGIGCNVNMPQEELDLIDRPATSLLVETKEENSYDVESVLQLIQNAFRANLNRFLDTGFAPFFQDYQQHSCFKEEQAIRFHDNQHIVEGFFYSLNPDGSLTLRVKENGGNQ